MTMIARHSGTIWGQSEGTHCTQPHPRHRIIVLKYQHYCPRTAKFLFFFSD